jgi:hypothetical protein
MMQLSRERTVVALCTALFLPRFVNAAPSSCEALSKLLLPDTSITLAQSVPAGEFKLPEDLDLTS